MRSITHAASTVQCDKLKISATTTAIIASPYFGPLKACSCANTDDFTAPAFPIRMGRIDFRSSITPSCASSGAHIHSLICTNRSRGHV